MNILPKKRWHVLNDDNVARVRRDETEYEKQQQQKQGKQLRAEHEQRMQLLKQKKQPSAGGKKPVISTEEASSSSQQVIADAYEEEEEYRHDDDSKLQEAITDQDSQIGIPQGKDEFALAARQTETLRDETGHFNFFQTLSHKDDQLSYRNEEYEKEKKEKELKEKEKAGLAAWKLGGTAADETPWYAKRVTGDASETTDVRGRDVKQADESVHTRDLVRKNKRDPLSFMYKVMKESDERHTEREEQRIDFAPRLVSSSNILGHATEHQGKSSRKNHREKESSKSIDSDYYVDDATDKSKKRHTESGAHRRKQRKSRKKRSKSSAAGDVDWKELREERRKREKEERDREHSLYV